MEKSKDGQTAKTGDKRPANVRKMFRLYLKNQKELEKQKQNTVTKDSDRSCDGIAKMRTIEEENEEVFEDVKGGAQPAICVSVMKPRKLRWKEECLDPGVSRKAGPVRSDDRYVERAPKVKNEDGGDKRKLISTKSRRRHPKISKDDNSCDRKPKRVESRDARSLLPRPKLKQESSDDLLSKRSGNPNNIKRRIKEENSGDKQTFGSPFESQKPRRVPIRDNRRKKGSLDITRSINTETEDKSKKPRKKKLDPESSIDAEEDDHAARVIAYRVALLMKRNQVLERTLEYAETMVMVNFFSRAAKPSDAVFQILDKAVSGGLSFLSNHSSDIDDVIDNQMRTFIIDQDKAKLMLVELLVTNPDIVPIGWKGPATKPKASEINKMGFSVQPVAKPRQAGSTSTKATSAVQPSSTPSQISQYGFTTTPVPPSPSVSVSTTTNTPQKPKACDRTVSVYLLPP